MSASDNLQAQQLQMFMPARQLVDRDTVIPGDFVADEARQRMGWQLKLHQSRLPGSADDTWAAARRDPGGPSLHESVRTSGVKTPVTLKHEENRMVLSNGHHRVAAAHDIDPGMEVPVEHVEGLRPHSMSDSPAYPRGVPDIMAGVRVR